eukprot:2911626-Alexandrium_andersonii.AAC.1
MAYVLCTFGSEGHTRGARAQGIHLRNTTWLLSSPAFPAASHLCARMENACLTSKNFALARAPPPPLPH